MGSAWSSNYGWRGELICERHAIPMGIVCGEPICGACFAEAAELVRYRPAKHRTPEEQAFLEAYYVTALFHGDRERAALEGLRV